MSDPALRLDQVRRSFAQGRATLDVLAGASLEIRPGEIVALVGPSGSGKSTLLQIAGLLEKPDDGEIYIAGEPCGRLSDDGRTRLRRLHLGFVYQYHHLLPEFSALENVVLPQMIAGTARRAAAERGRALLDRMGLAPRADHRPGQLSGGEQQRVAIARALANEPKLLLADEPTGNLDGSTGQAIIDLMFDEAARLNSTLVLITHDDHLAALCDRVVQIEDGRIKAVTHPAAKVRLKAAE